MLTKQLLYQLSHASDVTGGRGFGGPDWRLNRSSGHLPGTRAFIADRESVKVRIPILVIFGFAFRGAEGRLSGASGDLRGLVEGGCRGAVEQLERIDPEGLPAAVRPFDTNLGGDQDTPGDLAPA